jgi:hypothetical protein
MADARREDQDGARLIKEEADGGAPAVRRIVSRVGGGPSGE